MTCLGKEHAIRPSRDSRHPRREETDKKGSHQTESDRTDADPEEMPDAAHDRPPLALPTAASHRIRERLSFANPLATAG
ncbi:hypothetical protein HRbin27_01742 [bacterium HR27]|nr:hypothetical protein HRbin27_01742 [bacterium HR27]